MSHTCGRSLSEKKDFRNKQSNAADKKCCCVTTRTGYSKYFNEDKQQKIRRLKTRKERCQIRAGRKENKSHHHRCSCQSRKDLNFFPNCCSSCHLPTRKNTPISSSVPVTKEPSIITDSRLLGHHGLFNHEVKSISIERLLREQSKLRQTEDKTEEEKNDTLNLSSNASNPVLLSSGGLLGTDADEGLPVKKKAKAKTKTNEDSQEKDSRNLQFSNPGADITPGQRLQPQLYSSCESLKSINIYKNSFLTTKTKNTDSCMPGMDESLQLKPLADSDKRETLQRTKKGDVISDIKHPDKKQDYMTKADYLTSSPLQPSAKNFDQQHLNRDPDRVSKTTQAVAARLCECLHPPVPNRRNLLSETREVLLKFLQERHGPLLKANFLEVQRSLRFPKEPTETTLAQEHHTSGEDELLSTESSVKTTGSENFCWKSSPQSRNSLQQLTKELANPVDTFVNLLDETFRPGFSPHLHMDFEPPGTSLSELFAHSPLLHQGENVSGLELWRNKRSMTKKPVLLDSFHDNFMSHNRDLRERQQPHRSTAQPFFSYRDGHSADLQHFPQELKPSEKDRFYSPPFFPSRHRYYPQSNYSQVFGQLSPFQPNSRSNPTDMMHYPPSHMVERSLAPSSSSLPSPEHWSFPPMRLY